MGEAGRLVGHEREWALHDGENVIGREQSACVRIDASGVSRRHARIVVAGGSFTIEDLGSKNGTFYGDRRVSTPQRLTDGDVIRLGHRVRLVFRRDDDHTETELAARANAPAAFQRDGDLWVLRFDGDIARVADMKGFHDLARLLASPGTEVHCLELADRPGGDGAGQVLDPRARREIQSRVSDLQHQIDDADAMNDRVRAERGREELDRIAEVLSGALGLGGRSRKLGSAAERARSAVTWRIRSAIRKITVVHPRLGRHLENAVRTGVFCVYQPETSIDWNI